MKPTKKCTNCKKTKEVSEFYSGRNICKKCFYKKNKKYKEKKKVKQEEAVEYFKNAISELRENVKNTKEEIEKKDNRINLLIIQRDSYKEFSDVVRHIFKAFK